MRSSNFNFAFGTVLMIMFCISMFPATSKAQSSGNLFQGKFLITVKTTANQVSLTCTEGCGWKELSFNTPLNGKAIDIDQYGTLDNPRKPIGSNATLTPFHFILSLDQNGIVLEGKGGTAWTRLTFGCPKGGCNQAIDFYGMTEK